MNIIFLGTGTSMGVPVIGCRCPVCAGRDPRNRRRRASLLVRAAGLTVIVDTGPDFREQALAAGLRRLDAVLLTHSHADHVCGFDDIRRFNDLQAGPVSVYGAPATLADLSRMFPYIHHEPPPGISLPRVRLRPISRAFRIGGIRVIPLPVVHGTGPAFGFRIEADGRALAYIPDACGLPPATRKRLAGLDVMILDALRRRPHPHHYTLDACVRELQAIGARQSFLTHLGHDLDHEKVQASLPPGLTVPHDGLTVMLSNRKIMCKPSRTNRRRGGAAGLPRPT
jgi:phosphoribosyl 1,2-cyclic phosphate phosphodiesterase